MSKYRVTVTADVVIDVEDDDPHSVIRRCVDNQENWRGMFYDIATQDQVLEHLAFNRIANGCSDVSRLDGWADVPQHAATMDLDGDTIDFLFTEAIS